MASHSPPVVSMAKKIKLDKTYGPAPNVLAKYRDSEFFVSSYRAYQWTQGFDVNVSVRTLLRVTITCSTHPTTCPFSVTGKKTVFEEGKLEGQTGYIIESDPFHAAHNHSAPFHPLDLAQENERRLRLLANDPSLADPPGLRPITEDPSAAQAPTLTNFLASIHPSLATEEVLHILDTNGLPVDKTNPADLLDLEEEVYDLFKEIPGLEPMLPALVVDGVRRAKARRDAGEQGFNGGIDPQEWQNLEQWVLSQIANEERKQREESRGTPMVM